MRLEFAVNMNEYCEFIFDSQKELITYEKSQTPITDIEYIFKLDHLPVAFSL